MLNNRASYLTSGHPCLVSDFRVNAFSFSPLRIMFALVCCKWPLLVVDSFCAHFLEEFILTYMGAECCKSFFCLYWDYHMVLFFNLLIWCITLIDLCVLKNPCIPGINLTWSWCVIFLMCCWNLFARILFRIFASMFISDIGL